MESAGRSGLAAALAGLGWSFEFSGDDVCVAQAEGGGPTVVLLSPGSDFEGLSSLMIRSAWRRDDVTLAMVNSFNSNYRFVRVYLDAEDAPVLQMDVMLDGADDPVLPRALSWFHAIAVSFEGFVRAVHGVAARDAARPPN